MADAADVLVVHGPNLSQLGSRDPAHYGTQSLDDIYALIEKVFDEHALTSAAFQSEAEGDLVGRIHAARNDGTRAIICNFGAYTHTSIALRDAMDLLDLPAIEVHLSNIHARERMRHTSHIAGVVQGSIVGLGATGYTLAAHWVVDQLLTPSHTQ